MYHIHNKYYVSIAEAERSLHESKVHEHTREILRHLHTEDSIWFDHSLKTNGNEKLEDNFDHPCFDIFIENRYMVSPNTYSISTPL
jgi:hypothetical protein